MNQEEYIQRKLNEAESFLRETVGLRSIYLKNDLFKIFVKFGYVEQITLDEAPLYLSTLGYNFDNIESFTNGFIKESDYQIYAIRMEHHFNLFVIAFNKYNEMVNYYSVTISEETLNICYILEKMVNKN